MTHRHTGRALLFTLSAKCDGQCHAPATLLLGKNMGTHLVEGCMGIRIGLDDLEKRKIFFLPEFKSQIV